MRECSRVDDGHWARGSGATPRRGFGHLLTTLPNPKTACAACCFCGLRGLPGRRPVVVLAEPWGDATGRRGRIPRRLCSGRACGRLDGRELTVLEDRRPRCGGGPVHRRLQTPGWKAVAAERRGRLEAAAGRVEQRPGGRGPTAAGDRAEGPAAPPPEPRTTRRHADGRFADTKRHACPLGWRTPADKAERPAGRVLRPGRCCCACGPLLRGCVSPGPSVCPRVSARGGGRCGTVHSRTVLLNP